MLVTARFATPGHTMSSLFRVVRIILLSLILLVLALVLFAWLQGDRLLREAIERELQQHLVPTVIVAGPVRWTFSGAPALRIANLSLIEDGAPVVTVSSLVIVADLGALLAGRAELESAEVEGLVVSLRHLEDGRLNMATWLHRDAGAAGAGVPFPVEHLRVSGVSLQVDDDVAVRIDELNAGPIRPGEPGQFSIVGTVSAQSPAVTELILTGGGVFDLAARSLNEASFEFRGSAVDRFTWDGEVSLASVEIDQEGIIVADGLATTLALLDRSGPFGAVDISATIASLGGGGDVFGARGVDLDALVRAGVQEADLKLSMATLSLDGGNWDTPGYSLDAVLRGPSSDATARMSGSAEGARSGAISARIEHGEIGLPHPAGGAEPLAVSLSGKLSLDAARSSLSGEVAGAFDESRFEGSIAYEPGRVAPVRLRLTLDRLDLDRYLPPPAERQGETDFTIWRTWPVRADLAIGELRTQGFVSRNARLRLVGGEPVQQDVNRLPKGSPAAP